MKINEQKSLMMVDWRGEGEFVKFCGSKHDSLAKRITLPLFFVNILEPSKCCEETKIAVD